MKASETIKEYSNNHLNRVYLHNLPIWIQFLIFLYRGIFNGSASFKLSRIKCWFGNHKWHNHRYEIYKNNKITNYYYMCTRCGMDSKKELSEIKNG